jgi:hypothetical protein
MRKLSLEVPTREESLEASVDVKSVPDCSVYEHVNFNTNPGDDDDGWSFRTSLAVTYIGDDWNDEISSIIVHSGTWRFYEDVDYGGAYIDLGPGYHNDLHAMGWGDKITSYKAISW